MDVPANQKLWGMLTIQAKAKFMKFPSLPASKWIHTQYVQKGGRFIPEGNLSKNDKAEKTQREKKQAEERDKKKAVGQ